MEQKRTIIECRQVDKTFVTPKGDVPVVRDFHMQAGENELVRTWSVRKNDYYQHDCGPGTCDERRSICERDFGG